MKDTKNISTIYFIGIGGIGMSALARHYHAKGASVSGYDKTPSALSKQMEAEGIKIHYEENLELIPKNADLVVYTPAIPVEHKELVYYRENDYVVIKRSDLLGLVTANSFNICVAGTHGKTTITTLIAHVLRHSGYGCNAFLGGVSVNYDTNYWSDERNLSVVEADEYDRSFLKLQPDIAVITAMDPDHLDIYGTAGAMEQAFIDFSSRIRQGGLLVKNSSLERGNELQGDRKISYSLRNSNSDVYAKNLVTASGGYQFEAVLVGKSIEKMELGMGGLHNVENTLAAIAVADSLGITADKIREAVASFSGVKRRFEYVLRSPGRVFIDDYAHHPEELRALISSAKDLFRDSELTIIFQPHLFTRTRDLADGFAEVLSMASEVILLPIYPARELPIEGVSSQMILDKMGHTRARVMEKAELLEWVKSYRKKKGSAVLITAGAGDIDLMVDAIRRELE